MKIYYNENGWVCERYPYNIEKTVSCRYIDATDDDYEKTLSCIHGCAWRVVDGVLREDVYDEKEIRKQEILSRIEELNILLESHDYIGIKIAMGRATISDYSNEIQQSNDWAREKSDLLQELDEIKTKLDKGDNINV